MHSVSRSTWRAAFRGSGPWRRTHRPAALHRCEPARSSLRRSSRFGQPFRLKSLTVPDLNRGEDLSFDVKLSQPAATSTTLTQYNKPMRTLLTLWLVGALGLAANLPPPRERSFSFEYAVADNHILHIRAT